MNDLNRSSLDAEIERIHNKMAETDPLSEDYEKLVKRVEILLDSANDDDKIHANAKLEELKLDADADKLKENSKWQKIGTIASLSGAVLSSVTTIACYLILCISNKKAQNRSILFEMDGYSHTDRSDKFMQKAPMPKL